MEYGLSDLIELDKLKSLLESFYGITQIPSGIFDTDGVLVTCSGWRRICTECHEKNAGCRRLCVRPNGDLRNKKYEVVQCANGLFYIVCPIIVNQKHIANICQGQFLLGEPCIEGFREHARLYGFDENEYIEAVNKLPVLTLEKIQTVVNFLGQFSEMLGEMGSKQLTLMESQNKLNASEACWKFAAEAIGDGVWDWNAQNAEPFLSEKCYEILDCGKDERPHSFETFINGIHPEDRKNVEEQMKLHLNGKIPLFTCEYRYRCKDESYKWLFLRAKLISRKEDGSPQRVVGILSDINEKKRSEQEAGELDKLKNEFLANISHELKTPINVIYSASQLLDLYIESDTVDENLEKIKANQKVVKQNCYRSQRLINNLIDISRIDSGYFEIRPVNEDIISTVEDIALSVKDYIENNGISFLFDTELEEKIIAFDPEKIEKVILNLISNAVKFTEPGGTISINVSEKNGYVAIAVKDTGAGIPADKLEVIFERFKQVDGLFIRRSEGSGIGLTLVKSIIEMHGGKVSVESECGKGSVFTVELPSKLLPQELSASKHNDAKGNRQGFIQTVNIEFSDIYSKL